MKQGAYYYHFRCTPEERDMVHELARGVYRKDGEVIRTIIRGAYAALKEQQEADRLASARQPAGPGK